MGYRGLRMADWVHSGVERNLAFGWWDAAAIAIVAFALIWEWLFL